MKRSNFNGQKFQQNAVGFQIILYIGDVCAYICRSRVVHLYHITVLIIALACLSVEATKAALSDVLVSGMRMWNLVDD